MRAKRVTWNWVRYIYLGVGILAALRALASIIWSGFWPGPEVSTVIAVLILGVAVFASDDLFTRVHRILWRREWPK